MHKLFTIVFLVSLKVPAFSQSKARLAVNAAIIGTARPIKYLPDCYVVKVEVTNNEDTTLSVTYWSCSWFWNFKLNVDSSHIEPWGCDSNYPDTVNLPAHGSLTFCFGIYCKPSVTGRQLRIGFANWWKDFVTKNEVVNDIKPSGDFYWSNILTVEKNYPIIENYAHYFLNKPY